MAWQFTQYTSSPLGLLPQGEFSYKQSGGTNDSQGSRFSTKNFLNKSPDSENGFGNHPLSFKSPGEVHNDNIYDISTPNIVFQLKDYPTMRLKSGDFAYCRDYGVYPNNRLVICRRFDHPVIDDLTFAGKDVNSEPISTLISWMPDTENILSFNFGEVWVEAQASFKELLNDVGDEFGLGKINFKLGDVLSQGMNIVPLPGATETLQRRILAKAGFIDENTNSKDIIPSGTPNLIKESKQRQLIKEDQAGSGLTGKFSVAVKCAWEQKFISGVDPTIIYYDILQTILAFGGSEAVFYLGKRSSLGKLDSVLKDFLKPGGATELIKKVVQAFADSLLKVIEELNTVIGKFFDSTYGEKDSGGSDASKDADATAKAEKEKNDAIIKTAQDTAGKILKSFAETVIKKYRIQALGVVTTLTGLPSTPWHVTIGNPLRPIFSSGDMLTQDVTVNFGPQLAFNDLPSFIECTFTLVSARNLGTDEIMEKLSCSGIRVTNEHPTFWNSDPDPGNPPKQPEATTGASPSVTPLQPTDSKQEDTQSDSNPFASLGVTEAELAELDAMDAQREAKEQSKVGSENSTGTASTTGQTVNPDPNSADPVLGKTELPKTGEEEYTVKPGDSIWKISKNKLGPNATNAEINAEKNRIIAKNKNKNPAEADGIVKSGQDSDPDFLQVGDKLII